MVLMKKISTLIYYVGRIKSDCNLSNAVGVAGGREETEMKENQDNFKAPDTAVNAILSYARSLEVKETRSAGTIEWILN